MLAKVTAHLGLTVPAVMYVFGAAVHTKETTEAHDHTDYWSNWRYWSKPGAYAVFCGPYSQGG